MKKVLLVSLSMLVINTSFFSVAFTQDKNDVIEANNKFAFDLYAEYKSGDSNIFYSPYSISSALAMTYEGARGKTAKEIKRVFHFPENIDFLRDYYLEIYQKMNEKGKVYKLNTANALWAENDYKFSRNYFNIVEKYYFGKITNLDFVNKTEQSRLIINDWVEKKTYKKIKNLIPKRLINSSTTLVLTNVIYFKGLWLKQFNENDTKKEYFRVTSRNKIKVPMMRLIGSKRTFFNYGETKNIQILELAYKGNELSMLVILPKKNKLCAVEKLLNLKKLSEWKKLLKKNKLDVYLPKFKFETKYFMVDDLRDMGMTTAFGGNADFSGMTGKRDLFIGQIIHQAFVDVNEEGTEAAAATAVLMLRTAMLPEKIKVFKADRPFIFIIQNRDTGNILFMGRVNNPLE